MAGCTPTPFDIPPTKSLSKIPTTPAPTITPEPPYWTPSMQSVFQIQLSDYPPDIHMGADIYALDLFETTPSAIQFLHEHDKKVICYFNAGAWEAFRPDADKFPQEIIGNPYVGWPGEKWLDISRYEVFSHILLKRMDLAVEKGCDGVDPDNINGYMQPTGFDITPQHQLTFNTWLSDQAHQRGLAIGMKNNGEQILELADHFDFAIIEDCAFHNECEPYQVFIKKQKAVYQIEYTDRIANLRTACDTAHALGFQLLLKNRELDAFVQYCP